MPFDRRTGHLNAAGGLGNLEGSLSYQCAIRKVVRTLLASIEGW